MQRTQYPKLLPLGGSIAVYYRCGTMGACVMPLRSILPQRNHVPLHVESWVGLAEQQGQQRQGV
jgi:hypothetical protein